MAFFKKGNVLFNCNHAIRKEKQANEIALIQIVSALLIVNYHTSILNVPFFHNFAKFGFVFNTVFVGLSGYLLALSARSKKFTMKWLWRRFFRLYPPYWVAIAFIVIIQYFIGQEITIKDIAIHLTGLQYFGGYNTLGRHLWFISVIIACYFLFWPSFFFVQKKPLTFLSVLVCGFILAVFLVNKTTNNIYNQISSVPFFRFFYHYIIFVLGIVIATKGVQLINLKKCNPFFAGIILFVSVIPYELAKNNADFSLFAILMAVLMAVMFCMLLISIFKHVKDWHILFCLSAVTYEIYLIHFSCINLSGYLFSGLTAYLMAFTLTIVISFLMRYVLIFTGVQRVRN